jgi:hypothetical protein
MALTQIFLGVSPGVFINIDQIVWIDIESGGKSITLYLSAAGPSGKSKIKITDTKILVNVAKTLGIAS